MTTTHKIATEAGDVGATACGITWTDTEMYVVKPRRTPDWMLVTCDACLATRPTVVAGGWCAPSETIYGYGAHISRDHALWNGLVEPTPEERQAAADWLYEQETQANRDWFDTGVFLEKVKRHEFDALQQAILDLHEMCGGGVCAQCGDEYPVSWPCPTARMVLTHVGIEIPAELVYDKPKPVVQDNDNPRWPFPARPLTPAEKFGLPEISVSRGGITYDTGSNHG